MIVEFINTLWNGGAESLVKDYLLELKKRNIPVAVALTFSDEDKQNEKQIRDAGIPIIYLFRKEGIIVRIRKKLFGNILKRRFLKRIINEFHPDIIHCHLHTIKILADNSDLLSKEKLFYTIHNKPELYFSKESEVCYAIEKLTKEKNLHLITLYKEMEDEINNKYGYKNTSYLYNPVNNKFFDNFDKVKCRETYHIPQDALVLGNVGRFTKQKNHQFLIEIFKKELKINPNTYLVLVGDGEEKNSIIKLLKNAELFDKVKIFSNRNDVNAILATFDYFVFPSLYEGLPVSLLEAQSMNLKCLVSNNICKESVASNNVVQLDLSSVDEWVNQIQNFKPNILPINKINNFRIEIIINKLLEIFRK